MSRFILRLESLGDRVMPSAVPAHTGFFNNHQLIESVREFQPSAGLETEDPPGGGSFQIAFSLSEDDKKPSFDNITDIVNYLKKNKAAADILIKFEKDGGKVVSGDSRTGADIQYDPLVITIDPKNTEDQSDAVGALLFELMRYQFKQERFDVTDKLKKGVLTPDQYAEEMEKLTFKYISKQQEILQAAVRAEDWKITTDRHEEILKKNPKFEFYLKHALETGHYDYFVAQAKLILADKKE